MLAFKFLLFGNTFYSTVTPERTWFAEAIKYPVSGRYTVLALVYAEWAKDEPSPYRAGA